MRFVGDAVWHRSTPARIARAENWGTDSKGWNDSRAHLAQRAATTSVVRLLPRQGTVAGLGLAGIHRGAALHAASVDERSRGRARSSGARQVVVAQWIAAGDRARLDGRIRTASGSALRLGMPGLGPGAAGTRAELPGDAWWQLLDALLHAADSAEAAQDTLARQWLGTELPLTLAYEFPELKPARLLAKPRRSRVGHGACRRSWPPTACPRPGCWNWCRRYGPPGPARAVWPAI